MKSILEAVFMVKKYRQLIIGLCIGALLFGLLPVFADELLSNLQIITNPYPIFINGGKQEVQAYNIDGYTYLKLADIGKLLGANVKFNEAENKIEVANNNVQGESSVATNQNIKQTPDGITLKFKFNDNMEYDPSGKYYIPFTTVKNKCKEKNYSFELNSQTGKWELKDPKGAIILEAETKDATEGTYVEADYYINAIMPLLK